MTHTPDHTIFLFLGQVAGWLGVAIAIYLQMISQRRCRLRYVAGFFALGAGLIIAHAGLFDLPPVAGYLPILGYLIVIGVQLYAGLWVYRNTEALSVSKSSGDHGVKG